MVANGLSAVTSIVDTAGYGLCGFGWGLGFRRFRILCRRVDQSAVLKWTWEDKEHSTHRRNRFMPRHLGVSGWVVSA